MKTLRFLTLFLPVALFAQQATNVQKTPVTNAITGNLVVGDGKNITTSGTGTITGNVTASAVAVGNITGAGAGVLTALATPTSANLAAAVTDETGSGSVVFSTSPTLVTPTLGVFSGTSGNITGTAGSGFLTYAAQASAPSAPAGGFREFADSSGRKAWIRASDGFVRTWDATLTANRTYTLPDASGTVIVNANPANTTITNLDSVTATALANLTLSGGSTGASLVLGQGASAGATLSLTGTTAQTTITRPDAVGVMQKLLRLNNPGNPNATGQGTMLQFKMSSDTGNEQYKWGAVAGVATSGFSNAIALDFYTQGDTSGTGSSPAVDPTSKMRLTGGGNLLIGGTTDISGSGGLFVNGRIALGSATDLYLTRVATGQMQLNTTTGNIPIFTINHVDNGGQAILELKNPTQNWSVRNTGTGFGLRDSTAGVYPLQVDAGALSVGGVLINKTTASTSTTSGALQVAGGAGIAGAIYGGSTLNVAGATTIDAGSGSNNGTLNLVARSAGTALTTLFRTDQSGNLAITLNDATRLLTLTGTQAITGTTEATTGGAGSLTTAGGIYAAKSGVFGLDLSLVSGSGSNDRLTVNTNGSGIGYLVLNGGHNNTRAIKATTSGVERWRMRFGGNNSEAGSDSGTDFSLNAFTDAGASIDLPISIVRAAGGAMTLTRPTSFTNTTASTSTSSGAVVIGNGSSGGLGVGGNITAGGSVLSVSGTAGIGYTTGAGGTVTQATSRTTGVTLNKVTGAVTLVSAAGSTSWQSFTVTNSAVAATDTVRVCQKSGTDKYMIHVTAVGAGSFEITFATTGGTTTEQPVFNFTVIKGASS